MRTLKNKGLYFKRVDGTHGGVYNRRVTALGDTMYIFVGILRHGGRR